MTPRFDTYVAVFFPNATDLGPVVKFVTSTEGSACRCDPGQEAMRVSEDLAKDIVYGLTLNGYPAAVLKVMHGVTLFNTDTTPAGQHNIPAERTTP